MKALFRPLGYGLRLVVAGVGGFFGWAGVGEQVKALPAKPTDYVSDFAHVLSPAAVARIDRLCDELDHSKTNAQIAVVTVKSLDGEDTAAWANELEEKWKMAKK